MPSERPALLALTHRLPYAPNRGDRIRSYFSLRRLADVFDVHVISFGDADDVAHSGDVTQWAKSVTCLVPPKLASRIRAAGCLVASRTPLTHVLLDHPAMETVLTEALRRHNPQVLYTYCSGMARFAFIPVLRQLPWILDMVDVDSAKWAALGDQSRFPRNFIFRREARYLREFEARCANLSGATLVVNERERQELLRYAPAAPLSVLENGVDVDYFAPQSAPPETRTVVFCGVMNYQPNVEGVIWFARNVWPEILRLHPDARFQIVGASPDSSVTDLASPSIEVVGRVPDVRPYLWNAAVAVAPLLTSRGLQNKVLEALAAGLPVVVTEAVREGLPVDTQASTPVGVDARSFAAAVAALLDRTASERRQLALAAGVDAHSWRHKLATLPDLFLEVGGSPPQQR